MRIAHRVLCSAAAAGVALFSAACVIPPAGLAPRPDELAREAPDVAFYAFDSEYYNSGSGLLSYSTTRDAYAAVFEVDQRGRVQVLSPASPDADGVAQGGRSYVVTPQVTTTDPTFLSAGRDFDRIPYVFVLTSDAPLDLRDFRRGKAWSRAVSVGDGYDPDSVIAKVADRVLPGGADYASDYAYVGPQLVGPARAFLFDCARPVSDLHDYRYFRELWAVLDLQDQRLSYNPAWLYTPALGWSGYAYSVLPVALYRAQIATTAFYGGCAAPVVPAYSSRYAFAYNGYPYAGYAFGTYPYGWYYGGRTFTAGVPAQPTPGLRPPRPPLPLTGPVVAAGTAPRAVNTGRWLLGRAPAGPGQTAFGARVFGSGRRPGELQGNPRPGLAAGWARPGVFNPADRRGADPRSVGTGFTGRGGWEGPTARSWGQNASRPTGWSAPGSAGHGAFGGGGAAGGHGGASPAAAPSASGSGATAAPSAHSGATGGSAPRPQ